MTITCFQSPKLVDNRDSRVVSRRKTHASVKAELSPAECSRAHLLSLSSQTAKSSLRATESNLQPRLLSYSLLHSDLRLKSSHNKFIRRQCLNTSASLHAKFLVYAPLKRIPLYKLPSSNCVTHVTATSPLPRKLERLWPPSLRASEASHLHLSYPKHVFPL